MLSKSNQEGFTKTKSHPHFSSYQEGVTNVTMTKGMQSPGFHERDIFSPNRRSALESIMDSVARKKADIYQSIKGLEDTISQRPSHVISHEQHSIDDRTGGATRFSIVKGIFDVKFLY